MLSDFFSIIFPDYCLACQDSLEKGEEMICTNCHFSLPTTNFHMEHDNEMARRLWGKLEFKHAFAYLKFLKNSKVQDLIHELKYHKKKELGLLLGNWYGTDLITSGFNTCFDLVLPVPLHKNKQRARGYNQSDLFAKGLAMSFEIDWSPDVLERKLESVSQTKNSRLTRWKNVEHMFVVKDSEAMAGKRVLLVDDVVTTGATLEACGISILKSGAKEISFAALAIAM